MARTISDEELQLKRRARRRLIGAIVLVTAIVVGLPMLLDSEPRPPGQEISVQIPSPDSGVFTSKVVPLPAAPDSRAPSKAPDAKPAAKPPVVEQKMAAAPPPAVSVAPAPAKETPQETPAPKAEPQPVAPAKPAAESPAKPTAKPVKPAPKPKPKPAGGQFVVQVIALADAEKAKQLQSKIAEAGIKSYTEVVKTAKGDVTRVRAGPYATREAAEQAREQLTTLGLNGNITPR